VRWRLIWFVVAGGLGFIVDAGVLTLLVEAGLDPRPARLVSFTAAVLTTWLINRARTFGDRAGPPSLAELGRYVAASLVAATCNLAVFMALVSALELFRAMPVLAVAVATLVGMSINFWSYSSIVFRRSDAAAVSESRRSRERPSSGRG
jgi:putative flippase GtrA